MKVNPYSPASCFEYCFVYSYMKRILGDSSGVALLPLWTAGTHLSPSSYTFMLLCGKGSLILPREMCLLLRLFCVLKKRHVCIVRTRISRSRVCGSLASSLASPAAPPPCLTRAVCVLWPLSPCTAPGLRTLPCIPIAPSQHAMPAAPL